MRKRLRPSNNGRDGGLFDVDGTLVDSARTRLVARFHDVGVAVESWRIHPGRSRDLHDNIGDTAISRYATTSC